MQYEPNGTQHDDLVLYLGEQTWRCDSYYLALDEQAEREQQDDAKTRIVLQQILIQWRTAVEAIPPNTTVFLPFGLYDEGARFLHCHRQENSIAIMVGWANVEGHTILRSASPLLGKPPTGFKPEGQTVNMQHQDFVLAITLSMQRIR